MSQPLPRLVSEFLDRFVASLQAAADSALQPFIVDIRGVDPEQARPIQQPSRDHPAQRIPDFALRTQRAEERLCSAVSAVAPQLSFGSTYVLEGPLAALAQGMVWAEIAGPNGLAQDPSRRLGLFLLAPRLHYPLHGHVAEEIFFGLSGTLEVEHGFDGARIALSPGGSCRTPFAQPHALHIGDQPALQAYCWIGDFSVPTWFHAEDAAGHWQTTQPNAVRR